MRTGSGRRRRPTAVSALVACVVLTLGLSTSEARPARSDQVTITMLANATVQPGYQVLIANFERAYPNIRVDATFAPTQMVWYQLEATQLAAGSAPDLLGTMPGCGTPVSVCVLAKSGDLAPLVKEPWTKWSLPLVTSLGKYGPGLYAFEPALTPWGMFTNDSLFAKLRLKVPETFSQLLSVCRAAKADGTVALLSPGGTNTGPMSMIDDIAVATVYGRDPHWPAKLRAGTVSFDGSPGWHQALQRFVELNDAGCFEPGMAGISLVQSTLADFAQGGGLMAPTVSSNKGLIDTFGPQFPYSFHPFPGGTVPGQTETLIRLGGSLSINAHSSPDKQAAAQTFIDFVARPAQNALYTRVLGNVTQREFLKPELPNFMQPMASVFANHAYAIDPLQTWWNANVGLALLQDAIGLVTGQRTVDQVLQAMDAAWKQGPT
jgi:raffinose/stachyose/melibiose transport system substrate-binding protein